jgi:predicted RecA/RadA family phage recombinase
MRNFVQKGNSVAFVATVAYASGQGALIGDLFGVVSEATAVGAYGNLTTTGVFALPKAPADVVTFGEAVYWDPANAVATVVANVANGKKIGHACQPQVAGDPTINVRLIHV